MYSLVLSKIKEFNTPDKIDENKLDILKEYCDAISNIYNLNYGESFDVIINNNGTIKIIISCPIYGFVGSDNVFYELADRSIEFGFSYNNEDSVFLTFTFPSVCK